MTAHVFPGKQCHHRGAGSQENPAEERECDDERQRGREINICYNGN